MNLREWYKKNRHLFIGGNISTIKTLKQVHDTINEKEGILKAIKGKVSNGKVGIIWSGMDCDCAAFTYASTLNANPQYLRKFIDQKYQDAEGPLSFDFVTVEEANNYKRTSRDLALEAFEDGHSHVVYY